MLERIVVGNSSRSAEARVYHFEVACGSALECAACLDVYHTKALLPSVQWQEEKREVQRIVRMLVGLIRSQGREIRESGSEWGSSAGDTAAVFLDHEGLEVYQLALEAIGWADVAVRKHQLGRRRSKRLDELSTSIVLNIAEGNGRRAGSDRSVFVNTACSSALKGAVAIDLTVAKQEIPGHFAADGKRILERIASMLFALRGYCEDTATAE